MDAIERLRSELGQRMLGLAATDPVLDRAVNLYADGIATILSERATVDGRELAGAVDLAGLAWYARRFLALETEDEHSVVAGGHPPRSLTVAAICRLADRLAAPAS
ncbi:hypothetical protein K1W54_34480 [Micromonospora sp. CPCC 205371]|nr:hypothetical protein [Micromonospora sp. CPCC 205371]